MIFLKNNKKKQLGVDEVQVYGVLQLCPLQRRVQLGTGRLARHGDQPSPAVPAPERGLPAHGVSGFGVSAGAQAEESR